MRDPNLADSMTVKTLLKATGQWGGWPRESEGGGFFSFNTYSSTNIVTKNAELERNGLQT